MQSTRACLRGTLLPGNLPLENICRSIKVGLCVGLNPDYRSLSDCLSTLIVVEGYQQKQLHVEGKSFVDHFFKSIGQNLGFDCLEATLSINSRAKLGQDLSPDIIPKNQPESVVFAQALCPFGVQ